MKIRFLAAMSSSRSDVVTQFVCSSVRSFVRPSLFFSFSVFEVLSSPKEFQWCFKKVLSVFEVSGCFKEASRMFQGSFKGVYKKF